MYKRQRSPHVDKDSREHFEIRTHKRLMEISYDSEINGNVNNLVTQRTLGGTNRKQKRKSGFRARMRTSNGKRVVQARRKKGRHRLSV